MTNKEILLKALVKAKNNGYKDKDDYYDVLISQDEFYSEDRFIFSHEFAKALWGTKRQYLQDDEIDNAGSLVHNEYDWEYHLQQMVLWENPLLYLATFFKSECCDATIEYTENSGVYIKPGVFCTKCKKLL